MPRRSRTRAPRSAPPLVRRRGHRCDNVSGDRSKRVVRRYYEEVLVGRRLDVLDRFVAPGFVGYDPGGATMDRAGYFAAVLALHRGFSDLYVSIDDQVAEGDMVTTRWSAAARHTGVFAGIPGTGREVLMAGIDIHRLEGDRVVELWEQQDFASLLAQLL